MKVLISAVGTTDPIRTNHDGPLLHIARIYKPEKIILIFSEEMIPRKNRIKEAIYSIKGYTPIIEVDEKILLDSEVYIFDKMFEQISEIISRYTNTEDEFILNLSSATPQIISAMFTINRINDYNVRAVQVATPANSSNEKNKYDNESDIADLIKNNIDNCDSPQPRIIEDESEKFNSSLVKRNLRQLIQNYDYQAVYDLLNQPENTRLFPEPVREKLIAQILPFVQAFKYQRPLIDTLSQEAFSEPAQKAFNHFLMLDIMERRGLVADVLIKSKSLVEYILQNYIEINYSGLIYADGHYPKINTNHALAGQVNEFIAEAFRKRMGRNYDPNKPYSTDSTLNIHSFINIIDCLEPDNQLVKLAKTTPSLNSERNRVAHGLSEINSKLVDKKLNNLISSIKQLIQEVYSVEDNKFDYFDKKNSLLLDLLK